MAFNNLKTVYPDLWHCLKSLKTLKITGNPVADITPGAFIHLNKLTSIHVDKSILFEFNVTILNPTIYSETKLPPPKVMVEDVNFLLCDSGNCWLPNSPEISKIKKICFVIFTFIIAISIFTVTPDMPARKIPEKDVPDARILVKYIVAVVGGIIGAVVVIALVVFAVVFRKKRYLLQKGTGRLKQHYPTICCWNERFIVKYMIYCFSHGLQQQLETRNTMCPMDVTLIRVRFFPIIYVTALRSGDNLEHQSTLNRLQKEAGLPIDLLKYSPTERRWRCTGSAVQPRLSKLN